MTVRRIKAYVLRTCDVSVAYEAYARLFYGVQVCTTFAAYLLCISGVLRSIRTNGCVHFVIYQRVKISSKKSRLPPKKKKIEGEREVAPRRGRETNTRLP